MALEPSDPSWEDAQPQSTLILSLMPSSARWASQERGPTYSESHSQSCAHGEGLLTQELGWERGVSSAFC